MFMKLGPVGVGEGDAVPVVARVAGAVVDFGAVPA
jgi:hypothetical protein